LEALSGGKITGLMMHDPDAQDQARADRAT
jgi:hypothetical protein